MNTIFQELTQVCEEHKITLVAVSKTKSAEAIQDLYDKGQKHFGENYVQELLEKQACLPEDICWHFIGHLQTNKVRQILPFVYLIHSVDSWKLFQEIHKQSVRLNREVNILLQAYVAEEETKYGMDANELLAFMERWSAIREQYPYVRIKGIMGMASFTDDQTRVRDEMQQIRALFNTLKKTYFIGQSYFDTCSMGMSGDYRIAIEEGSTLLRIGSLLFGSRNTLPAL